MHSKVRQTAYLVVWRHHIQLLDNYQRNTHPRLIAPYLQALQTVKQQVSDNSDNPLLSMCVSLTSVMSQPFI